MKDIEKYIGYYLLVYVVVLALCGFIQYLYKCQGQSLVCAFSSDGVINILTVTAYVLTPIVAIVGFQSWKIEKQYDLEKSQAEKLINLLNEVNFKIYEKYHLVKPLYSIKEKIVVIPRLEHERFSLSEINEIQLIQQSLELLNQILNNQDRIDVQIYNKLYMQFHFFNQAIIKIEQCYLNHYYREINDEFKLTKDTQIIDFHNSDQYLINSYSIIGHGARRLISEQLYQLITIKNIQVTIADPLSKEVQESDKTFAEYKRDYDQSFNDLVKKLVEVIKPHKRPSL